MAKLPDRGHDEAVRQALLRADPLLSRYDPLERLLMHCDFDAGIHGWQTYFPDYDGDSDYPGRDPHFQPLDRMLAQSRTDPSMRVDRRAPTGVRGVPMLSTLTSWDVGTSGSFRGTYALKIPTAPLAGTHSWALRRVTSPWRGKVRFDEIDFTLRRRIRLTVGAPANSAPATQRVPRSASRTAWSCAACATLRRLPHGLLAGSPLSTSPPRRCKLGDFTR